ncbi:hypothetical protein TNCV_2781541 [Trichonephila clavipes]|nr:hypothetical protein TNCV_2781541 [Trichonephila clavipes]
MNETTQQEKTTPLGSRNETTQLASRNETTQLVSRNETTQLCTAVDRLQRHKKKQFNSPPQLENQSQYRRKTTQLVSRNETTQLGSRNETTQLGSRNETTPLGNMNETTQLVSRNETAQLCNRLQPPATAVDRLQPPATAYYHLQPPTTACNRLQPPATAYNRLQPPATACTAFTAESAFSTYSYDSQFNIYMTCEIGVPTSQEIGITQECGCVGLNGPDGRQGCVLTRTVESNQGGRLDSNESVADSFRSDLVNFKSWSARILGAFPPLTSARKNLQSGSELATRGHPSVTPILSDKYHPCKI